MLVNVPAVFQEQLQQPSEPHLQAVALHAQLEISQHRAVQSSVHVALPEQPQPLLDLVPLPIVYLVWPEPIHTLVPVFAAHAPIQAIPLHLALRLV